VVTNCKKANILRAQDALKEIIPGKCQLFDMLSRFATRLGGKRCALVSVWSVFRIDMERAYG
jgi:hypothetical protein